MSSGVTYGEALKTSIEREYPGYHLPTMDQETAEKKIQDYSGIVGSFFLWQNSATRDCQFTGIGSKGEIHHARLSKDTIQWTAENWNTITTPQLSNAIAGVLGSSKINPILKMMKSESVEQTKKPSVHEVKV